MSEQQKPQPASWTSLHLDDVEFTTEVARSTRDGHLSVRIGTQPQAVTLFLTMQQLGNLLDEIDRQTMAIDMSGPGRAGVPVDNAVRSYGDEGSCTECGSMDCNTHDHRTGH